MAGPARVCRRHGRLHLLPRTGHVRLLYISDLVGREVETTNDLTVSEASEVIERMLAAKKAQDEAAPGKSLRETQQEQGAQLRKARGAAVPDVG